MALARWKQPCSWRLLFSRPGYWPKNHLPILSQQIKYKFRFWYFHKWTTTTDLIQHSRCAKSLVKPRLTRVQAWFNQTGFYGCPTRLTRLYLCVKGPVNQAISGKLSKPGIILKKKNTELALSRLSKFWIYRANQASNIFWSPGWPLSTVAHSEKALNYGRLFCRWDLGKCQALIDYLFSPRSLQPKARNSYLF